MRFSERIGKRTPKQAIQVDGMDDDLRNGLWNVVLKEVLFALSRSQYYPRTSADYRLFLAALWRDFLKMPVDEVPTGHVDIEAV